MEILIMFAKVVWKFSRFTLLRIGVIIMLEKIRYELWSFIDRIESGFYDHDFGDCAQWYDSRVYLLWYSLLHQEDS